MLLRRNIYPPSKVVDGFDVADSEIIRRLKPGDLAVTADIPLAAEVMARGEHGMGQWGTCFLGYDSGPFYVLRIGEHDSKE